MTVPIHAKVSWVVYAKRKKNTTTTTTTTATATATTAAAAAAATKTKKKVGLKVMLHGTICKDDFQRKTALQHCCDIASNGCNIVPTLQRCVALKIVVANRPV